MQDALVALAFHRRSPAVDAGAFEQEVHQGTQTHAMAGHDNLRGFLWLATGNCTPYDPCPWEIHPQLKAAGAKLQHSIADELAQSGLRGVRFVRRARRMVSRARSRHALDDELAVPRHVHLHAALHAQAARALRGFVDARQRFLKPRVVRSAPLARDEEPLGVHGLAANPDILKTGSSDGNPES